MMIQAVRHAFAVSILLLLGQVGVAHAQVFPSGSAPITPNRPQASERSPDLTAANYLRFGSLLTGRQLSENVRVRLELGSVFFGYENADFRQRRVENIEDELRYSDDRSFFVETRLVARLGYQVHPEVRFDIGFLHRGLWGSRGNPSGTNALSQQFVGYLGAFDRLAVSYTPELSGPLDFGLTVGRHRFRIGGVPVDYILDDTVDGLSVHLGWGRFGTVRGLVDLFTASTLSDQSLRELQLDTSQPDRFFRGQINTVRAGGLYENVDGLARGLSLKAYYFYADIGASDARGTGADVSYNGALGNFADNDYTYTYGARGSYDVRILDTPGLNWTLTPFAEVARSGGIDRKEAVARDVSTEGNAYGGGVQMHKGGGNNGLLLSASYYHFDGPEHASDGLAFQSGFVSMNASPTGGLAGGRILGLRPSAAVDASGIRQNPNDKTRYSGTGVLHTALAYSFHRTRLALDYWSYTDTGSTFLKRENVQALDPPFGYSREQFAAQERLGQHMGHEFALGLSQLLNDHMRVGLEAGMFLPGAFYEQEISEVAGDQIGGDELFWVVSAGLSAWL